MSNDLDRIKKAFVDPTDPKGSARGACPNCGCRNVTGRAFGGRVHRECTRCGKKWTGGIGGLLIPKEIKGPPGSEDKSPEFQGPPHRVIGPDIGE